MPFNLLSDGVFEKCPEYSDLDMLTFSHSGRILFAHYSSRHITSSPSIIHTLLILLIDTTHRRASTTLPNNINTHHVQD